MDFNKSIPEIENKIGYSFKDASLLRQAFTRASYSNEHKDRAGLKYQSNEVLEFFGDSLLSAAIVTLLVKDMAKRYEHGISTTLAEGDFSNIKSKLSDKKNLSLATEALGLQKLLLMGEGDAKLGIENEPSVMEDLFESIIGAIYIDSGYDIKAVIASVSKMLDVKEYMSANTPVVLQSHKNALQEWCADKKHKREAPVYKTISETGPDHKKIYERACYIGDKIYGVGIGKNQKLADGKAAEEALKALVSEFEKNEAYRERTKAAEAVQKLKDYAQKNKMTSPEFRDLGETERSTDEEKEYRIECRFAGLAAEGVAPDKREAKALAAKRVLNLIEKPKTTAKKTKSPAPVSKNKRNKSAKSAKSAKGKKSQTAV